MVRRDQPRVDIFWSRLLAFPWESPHRRRRLWALVDRFNICFVHQQRHVDLCLQTIIRALAALPSFGANRPWHSSSQYSDPKGSPRKKPAYASALPSCSAVARSKFSTKPDQYSSRRWQRSRWPDASPAPSKKLAHIECKCTDFVFRVASKILLLKRRPGDAAARVLLSAWPPCPRIESAGRRPDPERCRPEPKGLRAGRWH